ncbi:MFS transporter [Qipengyuania sp. GH25]|uniref:MFS transporter n=1 Tax=Qipengyuania pacifica TaxID=2860199 RepID=A0ABS7JD08_9SPHN|nr:MFS transporter [Qipengyuania aerophila]MBX7487919.1 MFS transporter [Qipengyuania aerophila]
MTDRLPTQDVSVEKIVDEGTRFRRSQIAITAMCMTSLILDGFDVQAIGYVAPAIIREWGIDRAELTPVFSAGLIGMLIGSFALSWLADRIGRRKVLIGACAFFGACMVATAFVENVTQLIAIRFITGLGLGGIMPNAMALAGEFSQKRFRVTVMMLVASGFTIGAALGGLFSALLLEIASWHMVFIVGGLAPLLLTVTMLIYLPESLQFRLRKGVEQRDIFEELKRLRPQWLPHPGMLITLPESDSKSASVASLFTPERRRGTFVLFAVNFMNLIVLYFLASWLPTLLVGSGHDESTAIIAATCVQIAGIIGTLTMGRAIDRLGFNAVLIPMFAIAAIGIFLSGQDLGTFALFAAVSVAGFCIVGGQPALNSLAASFYPAAVRSTGIGWSLGFGRFGSILGPVLGGYFIEKNWSNPMLFTAMAAPAVISMALVMLMPRTSHEPRKVSR